MMTEYQFEGANEARGHPVFPVEVETRDSVDAAEHSGPVPATPKGAEP